MKVEGTIVWNKIIIYSNRSSVLNVLKIKIYELKLAHATSCASLGVRKKSLLLIFNTIFFSVKEIGADARSFLAAGKTWILQEVHLRIFFTTQFWKLFLKILSLCSLHVVLYMCLQT